MSSLSIGLVWLLTEPKCPLSLRCILFGLGICGAYFLCQILPGMLPGTDYRIDYSFLGLLLPVLAWLGKGKWWNLPLFATGLILLSMYYGGNQWWCLAALIPLAFYNGTRGKMDLKYLFYLYYPVHLVIIYLLAMIF